MEALRTHDLGVGRALQQKRRTMKFQKPTPNLGVRDVAAPPEKRRPDHHGAETTILWDTRIYFQDPEGGVVTIAEKVN